MARATPETPGKGAKNKTTNGAATPKAEATVNGDKATRRPGGERGWLAAEIDKVIRNEDASMTVSDIVAKVTNQYGEHPSSGAVSAALKRWAEQGYIEVTDERPMSFKKFTRKYAKKNFDGFQDDMKADRQAGRDAKKATVDA